MSKTLTYYQLKELYESSGHGGLHAEDLLKHLLVLNLQIEVMQEQLANQGNRIVSIDEELSDVSNLQVDLKTNIERQVMPQPNKYNPIESSMQYQHEQGLLKPISDSTPMYPNKYGGQTSITFTGDPKAQQAFDQALNAITYLNDEIDAQELFNFITFG